MSSSQEQGCERSIAGRLKKKRNRINKLLILLLILQLDAVWTAFQSTQQKCK